MPIRGVEIVKGSVRGSRLPRDFIIPRCIRVELGPHNQCRKPSGAFQGRCCLQLKHVVGPSRNTYHPAGVVAGLQGRQVRLTTAGGVTGVNRYGADSRLD